MNFGGLLFLLVAHYMCGRGILRMFRSGDSLPENLCLYMMTGVAVLSFVPCLEQLAGIPITALNISGGIIALTVALNLKYLRPSIPSFKPRKMPFAYEWPFFIVFLFLAAVSIWRCYYYPPSPRDLLTGPELLAEYAVKEHTMVSSVFTVDLSSTNNYFKSPFITGLQIIYKLLVCDFGQIWLSVLAVAFTAWLYLQTRALLHPLMAGMLLLAYLCIPDLFAYTYLVLYDYPNMVFYSLGCYFLFRHMQPNGAHAFWLSAFFLGMATYIRNETLVLCGFLLPMIVFYQLKKETKMLRALINGGAFLIQPLVFWLLCVQVFIRNFIPVPFDAAGQLNNNLGDVSFFFTRLRDMFSVLIFSKAGLEAHGYFIWFFFTVFAFDLFVVRKFSRAARIWLYFIAVVLIGLPLLGYLFPIMDLVNTTKRGLFKVLPLMLMYLCHSATIRKLSNYLAQKEQLAKPESLPAPHTTPE